MMADDRRERDVLAVGVRGRHDAGGHAFIWNAMLDTIDVDLFYGHKLMLGLAKRA